MKRRHIEDELRQLREVKPPASLRNRVLSSAIVADQPITWSDRVWFSRSWRLAAVGIALACLALDQLAYSPVPMAPVTAAVATARTSPLSARAETITLLLEDFNRGGGERQ